MSNLTLDRPTTAPRDQARPTSLPPSGVGSYVDSDGVRRTPQRVGSYVSPATDGRPAVGSYTDRDGVRGTARPGSYVRAQR